jgi:hypothetical protein
VLGERGLHDAAPVPVRLRHHSCRDRRRTHLHHRQSRRGNAVPVGGINSARPPSRSASTCSPRDVCSRDPGPGNITASIPRRTRVVVRLTITRFYLSANSDVRCR